MDSAIYNSRVTFAVERKDFTGALMLLAEQRAEITKLLERNEQRKKDIEAKLTTEK